MLIPNPFKWWRRLPQRTRVRIIAAIILIVVGAEAIVLAPGIVEIAILVDSMGVVFVVLAFLAYAKVSILYLRHTLTIDLPNAVRRSLGVMPSVISDLSDRLFRFSFYSLVAWRKIHRASLSGLAFVLCFLAAAQIWHQLVVLAATKS